MSEQGKTGWAVIKSHQNWYHVSRVVFVDGIWWELHWHESQGTRGNSKAKVRDYAIGACGLVLLADVYEHNAPIMNALRVVETKRRAVA